MKHQALLSASPTQSTLAFHFRYIMPGELLDSNRVAVLLIARVLRVLRRDLKTTGSVLVRAGHLLFTADLWTPLEAALRASHDRTRRRRFGFSRGLQHDIREYLLPLDRTFVVVVSGRLQGLQEKWSRGLRHQVRHPFLFSLEVDREDATLERIYLRQNTAVGEVRQDWSIEVDLEALDFEPNLFQMLRTLDMSESFSAPGLRTLVDMLTTPLNGTKSH